MSINEEAIKHKTQFYAVQEDKVGAKVTYVKLDDANKKLTAKHVSDKEAIANLDSVCIEISSISRPKTAHQIIWHHSIRQNHQDWKFCPWCGEEL